MWTPRQSIIDCVEQESVVAVSAGDAAHPGDIGHGGRERAGGEIDDSLAVGTRAGDALRGALADQQAVAGAPHVLLAWRSAADWCSLVALGALDHVLLALARDVNGRLAHAACDDRAAPGS